MLWHLEQYLANSSEFAATLRWSRAELLEVVQSLPSGVAAVQALERFRSLFGPGGAVPDPRNWLNAYVLEVGARLLPSENAIDELWGDYPDYLDSIKLAAFNVDFFSHLKEATLRLTRSDIDS